MAAAMLSRQVGLLLAVTALVMCTVVAVAQQQGGGPAPDLSGKGVCKFADPNVVNGCFKSFGQGTKFTTNPRGRVDCCVTFQGNDCLCEMKKAWAADKKGTGAQNKVDCVRNRKC
jgi:hypothetical protein